jgi:hypothetical protein
MDIDGGLPAPLRPYPDITLEESTFSRGVLEIFDSQRSVSPQGLLEQLEPARGGFDT